MATSTNFEQMSLLDLKKECRRRRAKTTGRKAELVERLEAYERNSNFFPVEEPCDGFKMTIPDLEFRDVNLSTSLPKISRAIVADYLGSVCKSAELMYAEQHLNFIRSASESDITYVKAQVRASMKRLIYNVDVSICGNGGVKETQCECAVGMGPTAICKHVAVVLLGLVDHALCVEIRTHKTCTQRLQTFHTPRRQSKCDQGSPTKAAHLKVKQQKTVPDPRPVDFRNRPEYSHQFRGALLNFSGISKMPISHLFRPANVRAVVMDHSYAVEGPVDHFLRSCGLIGVSAVEREVIQRTTIQQSSSAEWRRARAMRITSSNFKRVCNSQDPRKTAEAMLLTKDLSHVPAVKHGRATEAVAIQAWEQATGLHTSQCGLFVHPTHCFMAASPDRLVDIGNKVCVIEVKCPYISKDLHISPRTVPYLDLDDNGELFLKKSHDYYYQVQGQMLCTGFSECIFIVYTNVDLKYFTIKKDEEFLKDMIVSIENFFNFHFKPALLSKFLFKD